VKNYNLKAIKNQAGMTLIELTVVLLVLIGLAGLTLPYVSGFVGKTHNATSAASGADLYNALATYQASGKGLPNNLNVLTDAVGSLPNYIDNSWVTAAPAATAAAASVAAAAVVPQNFSATALGSTAGITSSLAAAGINHVAGLPPVATAYSWTFTDGTFNNTGNNGATFTPEIPNIAVTNYVTDKQTLGLYLYTTLGGTPAICAGVSPAPVTCPNAGIANALNYTPGTGFAVPANHQMIVLGIGSANQAVGKTLAAVPVHFGDKGSLQPQYTYSRFLAAIDVDTTGADAAKLIGIVHAPDTGDQWESLYSSISSYYQS
jgi:type II secretory pathway pseudopilin PulG